MPHNTADWTTLSGDPLIDGMLMEFRWAESVVTFAFPQTADAYPDYINDHPQQNFQPFSPEWADHARNMLAEVSSFTTLTFVEGDAETSSLRWGRFDDPHNLAYAWYPSGFQEGGDMWFANNENADPVTGDGVSHMIRHELGHALGLTHTHQGVFGDPIPLSYDSQEYSAMAYRMHTSQQEEDYSGYHNEQSFMLLDIQALQHLYGANFAYNATDTIYSFDPATGALIVNGVIGETPADAIVLRTIWDGGGVDTYDFSAFNSDQMVSLAPGAWSTFEDAMLAVMLQREITPGGSLAPIYAAGNLATAFQYQGDVRSLIENATTGAGNDSLVGNAANNRLDGGAGADGMAGGLGDDVYIRDNVGDIITELANEGTDTVYSSLTYTLAPYVENLTLTGVSATNGAGNSRDNVMIGNGAANTLQGNDGNDVLDGGAGADIMYGGAGNDTFYVDNANDVTGEGSSTGGTDIIYSTVRRQLGSNIENLTLFGSASVNGIGNPLNNIIIGNSGNNILSGNNGADQLLGGGGDDDLHGGSQNDYLDGGARADHMYGGLGNDTFVVDDADDITGEGNPSGGIDMILSSVTRTIGSNIEHMTLTGSAAINGSGNGLGNQITGNSAANMLSGNGGNDTLYGEDGNDILNGGAGEDQLDGGVGVDQMFGNAGDDHYLVDDMGDVTTEALMSGGVDTVHASVSRTLGANLENLSLTGSAHIDATGNSLDNVIFGNLGDNVITGAGGNDTLEGDAGDDTFMFALGSGDDVVTDFFAGGLEDAIDLSGYDGTGVTWTVDQVGADTVFNFTNGDSITLTNVTAGDLIWDGLFGYS